MADGTQMQQAINSADPDVVRGAPSTMQQAMASADPDIQVGPAPQPSLLSSDPGRPILPSSNTVAPAGPAFGSNTTPATMPVQSAQPAPPVTPAGTPPVSATSPNPHLHSLVGRVLGALAGQPPPNYSVDPSGRTVAIPAPPETTSQKVGRILSTVGTGLASGAATPQRKSGLGSALAGLGAGFGGETEKLQQQDLLKRKQASEDFEQQQRQQLQHHQILSAMALTAKNWAEAQKLGVDMDPIRQSGIALANSAKEAGIPGVQTMTLSEWQAAVAKDPDFAKTHAHLPAGFSTPEVDEQGMQVKPGEGQVTVIPVTGDGNMAMPQAFMDQVSKYAPLSGRVSKDDIARLPAGHEIPVAQLPALIKATEEGRAAWLHGEQNPTIVYQDGKAISINSMSHEPTESMKEGMVPAAAVEEQQRSDKETAETNLKKEETVTQKADQKQKLAEAAEAYARIRNMPGAGGPQTPEQSKVLNDAYQTALDAHYNMPTRARQVLNAENLNINDKSALLGLWDGTISKDDWTKMLRQKVTQIPVAEAEGIVKLMDTTWDPNKFTYVKKLTEQFQNASSKQGAAILGNGQLMRHSADALQAAKDLQTMNTSVPIMNMTLNDARKYFGQKGSPELARLERALTASNDEWQNIVNNGHAAHADEKKAVDSITNANSNLQTIVGSLNMMGTQSLDRLEEVEQPYIAQTGRHYKALLSPAARDAAVKLGLGERIKEFGQPAGLEMVQMKAPDGTIRPVPAEQVEHYKAKGATVVQQAQ